MPAHIIQIDDARAHAEQLAAALEQIEAREDIISVTPTSTGWVVATRKRVGRPRQTEKRATP